MRACHGHVRQVCKRPRGQTCRRANLWTGGHAGRSECKWACGWPCGQTGRWSGGRAGRQRWARGRAREARMGAWVRACLWGRGSISLPATIISAAAVQLSHYCCHSMVSRSPPLPPCHCDAVTTAASDWTRTAEVSMAAWRGVGDDKERGR
jgi:hypothetical protein